MKEGIGSDPIGPDIEGDRAGMLAVKGEQLDMRDVGKEHRRLRKRIEE